MAAAAPEAAPSAVRYDDRIDVDPVLGAGDVLRILRRSLAYVWPHRRLFGLKFLLMLGGFAPALVAPWPLKIMIDHVVIERPLAETDVRFPPFMASFLDAIAGLDTSDVLLATLGLLAALVAVFGAGVGETRGNFAFLAQGQDTATQSENMVSAGWSIAGGLWGLADLLCNIRLVQRVTDGLRTELFGRLVRLPMPVLDDQRIGDGVYRTMYDAPAIQGICFDITLMPAVSLLGAVVAVVMMHYSYGDVIPELVWLAAATMPAAFLFTAPLAGWARSASQASRAAGAATTNRVEEGVANIAAVQSHGAEARSRRGFARASAESFRRFRHIVMVNIGIDAASGLAMLALGIWAFLLVTDRVVAGELLPGSFLVVLTQFGTVAGAVITVGRLWVDFQGNAAGVRRVFFFLDLHRKTAVPGGAAANAERRQGSRAAIAGNGLRAATPAPIAEIAFEGVGFAYADGRPTLADVSFRARAGQLVAIVGPTGAGKTTLAYMVPRFLDPTAGRLLIDRVDARTLPRDELRARVTYIFQEHMFFGASIADNLRLGRPAASDDELRQAARAAGAHDFLQALPAGYQTVLGRDGDTLSVGQKQRLSIARGLLRETPVLILDEPTAALDPESERAVVATLAARKHRRLVFVIAHRLTTIASADWVLFLEQGRIAEQGPPEELRRRDGPFRRFATLQEG